MRSHRRQIPPLVHLFQFPNLALQLRRCRVPSSLSASSNERRSAVVPASTASISPIQGPRERLVSTSTLSLVSDRSTDAPFPVESQSAAPPAVRLSPSAAALLQRRSRDSVMRQNMCAADLLYFMNAELHAVQQQRQEQRRCSAKHTSTTPLPEALGLRLSSPVQLSLDTSLTSATLTSRGQQLAAVMVGRTPRTCAPGSTARHGGVVPADEEGIRQRQAHFLFRQQQTLFTLRRRLAYMLADGFSDQSQTPNRNGCDGGREGPLLGALGRRTALALSLAQDVIDASNLTYTGIIWEGGEKGKKGEGLSGGFYEAGVAEETFGMRSYHHHHQKERYEAAHDTLRALLQGDGNDVSPVSFTADLHPSREHHSARCAFVYRSLAQPVEMTARELDALLLWCSELVTSYTRAVAEDIQRGTVRASPNGGTPIHTFVADGGDAAHCSKQQNSSSATSPVLDSGGDVAAGGASAAPAFRTSASHPPPTLQMAVARSAASHLSATSSQYGVDFERRGDNATADTSAQAAPLSPEVREGTVAAVTTMLELAAAFVSLSAKLLLSSSATVVGSAGGHAMPGCAAEEERRGGGEMSEEIDGRTLVRGRMARAVVITVCDTLHLFHTNASAGLQDYARNQQGVDGDDFLASLNRQSTAAAVSASFQFDTQRASAPQAQEAYRQLSFTDDFMQNVLYCSRESWLQALQLTRRMHEWNVQLREALTLPSTSSETTRENMTTSQRGLLSEPLSSLRVETLSTLLCILAQHGRVAEMASLCQDCLNVSAELLFSLESPTPAANGTAAQSTHVTPALRLMAHLAAANADPTTAALTFSSLELPPSVGDAAAGAHTSIAPRCTQADSVEHVVRAGVMPQRVLSVTEYALLLRRMIGARLSHEAYSGSLCNTAASGDSGGRRKSLSCGVGWWLSPSQVWRFSVGYPHHVRTTLCLLGFQVRTRQSLTAALSMEDLYVVLSVSRQQMTQLRREALEQQQREEHHLSSAVEEAGDMGVGPVSCTPEKGGAAGTAKKAVAASERLRRAQRWAMWGVAEAAPSLRRDGPLLQELSTPLLAGAVSALSSLPAQPLGALPLMARRVAAPCTAPYIACVCAAFTAAQCGILPLSKASCSPVDSFASKDAFRGPPPLTPILLSLVSKEMLQLLQAARYTCHIGDYWEAALRAVSAPLQAPVSSSDVMGSGAMRASLSPSSGASYEERNTAERVVEEVAYALAHAAEAALTDSLAATLRLVAPLPHLAPYLSAYTVGALVQRPFRRVLTWEQCLTLLPYTPLGSRSQLWLLRRVAQDGEGRRRAFSEPAAPLAASRESTVTTRRHNPSVVTPLVSPVVSVSQTAVQAAEQLISVQENARRLHSRAQTEAYLSRKRGRDRTAPVASPRLGPAQGQRASVTTESSTDADAALLTLLLEGHWNRALSAFERSSARVRVGGAPHVVRLLIEADVWRDLADVQRRPLVRLAVQSSANSSAGGAAALLEEVLETSLVHGLWHTGLYFHQSVAAEQPELVQQCRRAQVYAAQLCRGLLERTSLTRTVAQLLKAARQSQWAEAAACFLRYATRSDSSWEHKGASSAVSVVSAAGSEVPPSRSAARMATSTPASATTAQPTDTEELRMLIALMDAQCTADASHGISATPFSTPSSCHTSSPSPRTFQAFSFFAEGGGTVPVELAHVAHTVRYAMLHTPALWMHALRWLPPTVLPLPYTHEVAIRALCAGNSAKLHALMPHLTSSDTDRLKARRSEPGAVTHTSPTAVSTATATALSIVAAARRSHRPQHPNEVVKDKQQAVTNALRVLKRAGAWEEATVLYEKAVESHCMPYAASTAVLETTVLGGAPWQVTLFYFFHMAQRLRPDVAATAVALQACADGGQWALAFRVLQQSVLTQTAPVPRLVDLAVTTALHCGVWARALAAAQQYRHTRDPRLAHTVLLTFVSTQHWDDAVEYFYECTRRGLRPLDASLELAIVASEAASDEYRKTALMVGTIASALEDLYKLSGAVLEHIMFVQRHVRRASSTAFREKNQNSDVYQRGGSSSSAAWAELFTSAVGPEEDSFYRHSPNADHNWSMTSIGAEGLPPPLGRDKDNVIRVKDA